jgi:hypothetical protein
MWVSLPHDPPVHNVVVQEGEREGQKAVLLESIQQVMSWVTYVVEI